MSSNPYPGRYAGKDWYTRWQADVDDGLIQEIPQTYRACKDGGSVNESGHYIPPVKQSTLDMVDAAAKEMRFRDKVWQENRDVWFKEWYVNRPVQDFGEFVDHLTEQIRRGK